MGGDADGTLPSYNAGTYTSLSWAGFSMFGRKAKLNYNTEAVTNASGVTTYVEIWKVEPELALTLDREQIEHGAEFTASLTINNHFDNMEGLPAAEEVVFIPKNAVQISDTVKENNQYTASFRAVTDPNASELEIEAGVSQDAVNYKPKTLSLIQALPTQDIWSINIEKRWDGVPAVSYTHLDVYKRQDGNKTPGIDCTTGSLGQGLSLAAGMAYGLKPVSYTHLDVYKRQVSHSSSCASCLSALRKKK